MTLEESGCHIHDHLTFRPIQRLGNYSIGTLRHENFEQQHEIPYKGIAFFRKYPNLHDVAKW